MKQPDLSIIIPAYSEEKRIGKTLDELSAFLRRDGFFKNKTVEVLIVVADSADATRKIVKSKQRLFKNSRLLRPGPRVGKGRDVRYGMLRASGKMIIYMDADLATPLSHLRKFYEAGLGGDDLVVGTRELKSYRSSRARSMLAAFGNWFWRVLGSVDIEDTQCGFKLFNEKARDICFSKQTLLGWGFDMEILTIAKLNGLSIRALRINDWQDMPHSTYNEGMLRLSLRSIRDYLRIKINIIRGKYLA